MAVYSGYRLMKKVSLLSTDGCFQRVWMWGTSRALQMDWTALTEELWDGPNTATTPRASWSHTGGSGELFLNTFMRVRLTGESTREQCVSHLFWRPRSHQTGWSSEYRRWVSCWGSASCCGLCCLQQTWRPARPCSLTRSPGSRRSRLHTETKDKCTPVTPTASSWIFHGGFSRGVAGKSEKWNKIWWMDSFYFHYHFWR